jgi:hypothetical protein
MNQNLEVMKANQLVLLLSSLAVTTTIFSQGISTISTVQRDTIQGCVSNGRANQRRLNFYIANKPKTLDLFSRLVIIRARKQGFSRHHDFIAIVATSSKEVRQKMERHLRKNNAMIGSLWFDTHGRYANGYSSFILGTDEFSYKTIRDTVNTAQLRALAPYCDEHTRVAIGSCYSGATFEKPAHNGVPASRMNGDSLMIGLAHILPNATIYGTEGWVMTKPGIFKKHCYALAGYPLQKRFRDEVYRPVWEHMGMWHSYSSQTNSFQTTNTLSLTRTGTIHVKAVTYLDRKKSKERLAKNLKKLRPNVLKS